MGQPAPTAPVAPLSDADRRARLAPWQARLESGTALHVFAYGSLLWRPAFDVASRTRATLADHLVANCIWTVEARGTPECPGLGLGLMTTPGAEAPGEVLEVPPEAASEALAALGERELYTGCYQPADVEVTTPSGVVQALTFVADPAHPQFAGLLSESTQIAIVARASGVLGSNLDYLRETVAALARAGCPSAALARVARGAEALRGAENG